MIDDLDSTIGELLQRGLAPSLVEQLSISFATPDNNFPPVGTTLPAVNFFLYDMRENLELRKAEWEVTRDNSGAFERNRPARRVDCSYLVTAWARESSTQATDEHRLLGEVMQVLVRYPKLPKEILQGELVVQKTDLPTSSLRSGHLQSLGEFWQALGGKPKIALHYTVTLSLQVMAPEYLGPPVLDKTISVADISS